MIRNDFTCLGKKCRTEDGAATVYMDLPSTTTRCPVCGSRRITKIFSANFSVKGVAKHVDEALEHSGLRQQLEQRDRRIAAETADAHDRPRPGDAVVAGHAANLGHLMARATSPWTGGQSVFPVGATGGAAKVPGLAIYNGSRGRTPMPRAGAPVVGNAEARPVIFKSDGQPAPKV